MKLEHWPYFLIILLLILALLKDCGQGDSSGGLSDTIHSETTYRFDTVIHLVHTHKIHYKPAANADTSRFRGELPADHNPSQPVQFSDSLIDSNFSAYYAGVLWENRMFNPEFRLKWNRPTSITNTTVIAPKKWSLHAGPYLSFKQPSGLNVGGQVTLQTKGGQLWSLGYATDKTALIGLQWKIRIKR